MTDNEPRSNIENALWGREESFHDMFKKHNAVALVIEPASGQIMDANLAAEKFYGYSIELLRQMNITEINTLPPDEVALERQRALHEKRSYFVFPHRLASGETRTVEVHSSPITLNGRQLLFSIVHDITARKEAEMALREKETHLRSISDNLIGGMIYQIVIAPDGARKFTYLSDAVRQLYAISPEEGMADAGLIYGQVHEDDVDLLSRLEDEAIKNLTVFKAEARIKNPSGEIRWSSFVSTPKKMADGSICFDGVEFVITDRKQIESSLRKSKQQYDKLTARIPVGVYILRTVLKIFSFEYASPRLAEMLDLRVEELLTSPEFALKKIFPEDAVSFTNFSQALDGRFQPVDWTGRVLVKGQVRRLHIVSTPEPQEDGSVYWHGLVTDITEHVIAEEKIRQLNADLEKRVDERTHELREAQEQLVRHEKLSVLGQMASSIGHELRNPLGVISSAVYYLNLVQPNADDKIKQYLGIIDQEVRTSEKIISDLLDFARIKSIDREVVSASELIDQTLLRFPVPASVNVSIEIEENLPRAYVDPRQMVQVLGNLTTNAWQAIASAETKNSGQLSLCSTMQNDMINITVKDNGDGISPENMKKLFEPLFTTKAKGIGLGLAVSRKLVEANGGRIEVESEAGRGSSFHVFLPIFKEIQ